MRPGIQIATALCVLLATVPMSASILTLNPVFQTVNGGLFTVHVDLALTSGGPVGSFDVTVGYDSSLISFAGLSFGPALGDLITPQALTDFTSMPSSIEFTEVSLLDPTTLSGLQPSVFTLGTISFNSRASGTSPLTFSNVLIDGTSGSKLPVGTQNGSVTIVPEPATVLFAAVGLFICAVGANRRKALTKSSSFLFYLNSMPNP